LAKDVEETASRERLCRQTGSPLDPVREVPYRFEVGSLEGLIQQLAQSLLPNGYHFYVMGRVPEGKDPRAVDAKLMYRYGVAVSKFTRARRKRAGLSNVAYLRLGRMFLLLATPGRGHPFFEEERASIRDARKTPIKVGGYAVAFRGGRASVRIERETFKLIKGHFVGSALSRSAESLEAALLALPFEPYRPVRRQLFEVVRLVNRRRKLAGLPLVSGSAIRWHRAIVTALEPVDDQHRSIPNGADIMI
jgi:hypothetical protein